MAGKCAFPTYNILCKAYNIPNLSHNMTYEDKNSKQLLQKVPAGFNYLFAVQYLVYFKILF